eukprot:4343832-Amphidinium_carterae.1
MGSRMRMCHVVKFLKTGRTLTKLKLNVVGEGYHCIVWAVTWLYKLRKPVLKANLEPSARDTSLTQWVT